MPRKRHGGTSLGRSTNNAKWWRSQIEEEEDSQREDRLQAVCEEAVSRRSQETPEQRAIRLEGDRDATSLNRSQESQDQRSNRLQSKRVASTSSRSQESQDQRSNRLQSKRVASTSSRSQETPQQRASRLEAKCAASSSSRSHETSDQHDTRTTTLRTSARIRMRRESATSHDDRLQEQAQQQRHVIERRRGETANAARDTDVQDFTEEEAKLHIGIHDGGSFYDQTCQHCKAFKWPARSTFYQQVSALTEDPRSNQGPSGTKMPRKRHGGTSLGRSTNNAKWWRSQIEEEEDSQREDRLQAVREEAVSRRSQETPEQRAIRLEGDRDATSLNRSQESQDQRSNRLQSKRVASTSSRSQDSQDQRSNRLQSKRVASTSSRSQETPQQRASRLEAKCAASSSSRSHETSDQHDTRTTTLRTSARIRMRRESATSHDDRLQEQAQQQRHVIERRRGETANAARDTDVQDFTEEEAKLHIGIHDGGSFYDQTCQHCKAFKWPAESESVCCGKGTVVLDPVPPPPPRMERLFDIGQSGQSFLKQIVAYNNLLCLASLGYQEPRDGVRGYRPTFKIQGKVFHRLGSLLPSTSAEPHFAQLFFHDSDNELQNRMSIMGDLNELILQDLQEDLHCYNAYVRSFKAAIELSVNNEYEIVLHADKKSKPSDEHCRRYNLPQASEVAAIVPGSGKGNLDIIIHCREGGLQRINTVHRSYDPLFYVLLFPYGSDGWQLGLKRTNGHSTLTATDFYSHRLQVRKDDYNIIIKSRRLMQQYAVDSWAKIESSRMLWVNNNQATIRAEKYRGLVDAIAAGDEANAGRKIILPPTIYGSPRFYAEQFQNSMCIVRHYGKPDYFITFTTNPKWKEIRSALHPGEEPCDRPDLCARVFKMKFDALMEDLLKKDILGKVRAHSATIEWQKRGLTHAHILLIMDEASKPKTPEDIDKVVCAELPCKIKNPDLYKVITSSMIHGPCGAINFASPCMDGHGQDRHCTKDFPKPYRQATVVREHSFPEYRRRQPAMGGRTVQKLVAGREVAVDNSFVVPYNPLLSLRYDAHINCEVVYSVEVVKYLYKYICKGVDRIMVTVREGQADERQVENEIETFINARYISASEACWRIYQYPIHSRKPAIEKLPCHLPDEQSIIYQEGAAGQAADQGPPVTKLTDYFLLNQRDPQARAILYPDIPQYFTWTNKQWRRRKRGPVDEHHHHFTSDTLGRIPTISLSRHQSELYYLRMLLHHKASAESYQELRTIDGEECENFQAACVKLGLLEDDAEKDRAMEEAASIRFGPQLREAFATILLYCTPAEPLAFWEKWERTLAQDLLNQHGVTEVTELIRHTILLQLQERVEREGLDLHQNFGLPLPDPDIVHRAQIPRVIREETEFDHQELHQMVMDKIDTLNPEQRNAYDKVLRSVHEEAGQIFCLNASGGTGKTYTINLILAQVRSEKKIALATAMSGIAATLLDNGRTLHSRCKVPLALTEHSICNFTRRDATGKLLQDTALLVIDEISMGHRHIFECLDRSLRDIRQNDKPFGGITVLFAGDWKQILPVIRHGARPQIVEATLKRSELWEIISTLELSENMRVANAGQGSDAAEFAQYLMDIGTGKAPIDKDLGLFKVKIPDAFLLQTETLASLCDFVFEGLAERHNDPTWLASRAVIAPTNKAVDMINSLMMARFPGEEKVYKSSDSVDNTIHYPLEFINRLTPSGFPPHVLKIKRGSCIMLLRNFDASNGHCNGTRYIVLEMTNHIIEAVIATGPHAGKKLFIPRIPMIPSDNLFPFTMRRKQFPIRPAFAVTANKSQGQTLQKIGIFLPTAMFSHGQYYVANSRVGSSDSLKILTATATYPGKDGRYTDNVVYPEIL